MDKAQSGKNISGRVVGRSREGGRTPTRTTRSQKRRDPRRAAPKRFPPKLLSQRAPQRSTRASDPFTLKTMAPPTQTAQVITTETLQRHFTRMPPAGRGQKMGLMQLEKHREKLMRKLWQKEMYSQLRVRARNEGAGDVDDFELWKMFHESSVIRPARPAPSASAADRDRSSTLNGGKENISSSALAENDSIRALDKGSIRALEAFVSSGAEKQQQRANSSSTSPRSILNAEWERAQQIEDDMNSHKLFHLGGGKQLPVMPIMGR